MSTARTGQNSPQNPEKKVGVYWLDNIERFSSGTYSLYCLMADPVLTEGGMQVEVCRSPLSARRGKGLLKFAFHCRMGSLPLTQEVQTAGAQLARCYITPGTRPGTRWQSP